MDSFQNLKNALLSNAHSIAEQITPVLTTSRFVEKGVLTPTEFVEAGDQLVLKCPSWSWATGDEDKIRAFLPRDKQFLITRSVPCNRRVKELMSDKLEEKDLGDGWLSTGNTIGDAEKKEYGSIEDNVVVEESNNSNEVENNKNEEEEYEDLDSFVDDNLLPSSIINNNNNKREEATTKIIKTRRYDLSITYDKYYQSPRMWLFGYNEQGLPLSSEEIFQDISQDYVNKTATIEFHPHLKLQCASIHPCRFAGNFKELGLIIPNRHAEIMKKIVDNLTSDGSGARVDQAMFIFLKFLQSIVPTIDYDFTIQVSMKKQPRR